MYIKKPKIPKVTKEKLEYFIFEKQLKRTEIAKILNCNKTTITNYCNKYKINAFHSTLYKKINNIEHRFCKKCDSYLTLDNFWLSFNKKKQKSFLYHWCKKCDVKEKRERIRTAKQNAVNIFGKKCFCCGYDKCNKALHFHHINPKEKKLKLARIFMDTSSRPVYEELKKCIMVCSNCHEEIHEKLIDLPSLLKTRKGEYESFLKNLDELLIKR